MDGRPISSPSPPCGCCSVWEEPACCPCSPAARINSIAGGLVGGSETVLQHESPLTHGLHTLHGGETWIRAEVVDHQGRRAWTNPIWL